MITVLEIIDTAVKVGFGAIISGVTAWILAWQAAKVRRFESTTHDLRGLIKDFSKTIESAKFNMDKLAHAYCSSSYGEARDALLTVMEEIRSAQALANIIDNRELLQSLCTAEKGAMNIYHELCEDMPVLEKLIEHEELVFSSLKVIQPIIAVEYRKAKT